MATRRQAREWALQILVQFDLNPPLDVDAGIEMFWEQQRQLEIDDLDDDTLRVVPLFTSQEPREQASLAEMKAFAEDRVRGTWAARDELDAKLEPYLKNWSMYRLGTVERSVLRLGAWELSERRDIPAPILACAERDERYHETSSACHPRRMGRKRKTRRQFRHRG